MWVVKKVEESHGPLTPASGYLEHTRTGTTITMQFSDATKAEARKMMQLMADAMNKYRGYTNERTTRC